MLTLGDIQNGRGRINQIASSCTNNAEFLSLVNDALERAMRRGDFPDTLVPIFVCARQGCVVWPRFVGKVRKVNICNRPVQVHNLLYQFMDGVKPGRCTEQNWLTWGQGWLGSGVGLENRGNSPVFQDIQGDGRLVRVYPRCQNDVGKTLTIYGTDNNGQPLMSRDSSGNWSFGVTITMAIPFGSTSTYVRSINRVIRDATQCPVDVYSYNASADVLEDVAHYSPSETEPSYEKTSLSVWPTNWPSGATFASPGSCCSSVGVLALVKLAFIPLADADDVVPIDNAQAIKMFVMAVKAEESGNFEQSKKYEAQAVYEMNRQAQDESPEDDFSVTNNVLGPGIFSNQCF